MSFITGSCFLLCTPASICYLPHIYRVINYLLDKTGREARYCSILTQLLRISMIVQIICHAIDSIIGMNIPVKNYLNNFHFILCDNKFTIFQLISIRSKSAIPFTFSCLLLTPSHCLHSDIFPLHLCYCSNTTFYILTRMPFIRIFSYNLHILKFSIFSKLVLLCIQAVTINPNCC